MQGMGRLVWLAKERSGKISAALPPLLSALQLGYYFMGAILVFPQA